MERITWFTADAHFGHSRVIEYAKRPFASVEEMDQTMINNWNSVVGKQDIVYYLGDFSFYKDQQKTVDVINKLNGSEIHLILGNHDKHMKTFVKEKFTSVQHYKEIYVPDSECHLPKGQMIVLMHYAMRVFNKSHRGVIQLYGHSHGTLPGNSQQLDVGVDSWNFTPVSYEQIKEKLKTLPLFRSEDRHNKVEM